MFTYKNQISNYVTSDFCNVSKRLTTSFMPSFKHFWGTLWDIWILKWLKWSFVEAEWVMSGHSQQSHMLYISKATRSTTSKTANTYSSIFQMTLKFRRPSSRGWNSYWGNVWCWMLKSDRALHICLGCYIRVFKTTIDHLVGVWKRILRGCRLKKHYETAVAPLVIWGAPRREYSGLEARWRRRSKVGGVAPSAVNLH